MGAERDDGEQASALRVVDVAVSAAILSTFLAGPGIYWLLHHEPHDDVAGVLLVLFIVPASLIGTAGTLWWALRSSSPRIALRCVAIPVLAGAIGTGGLLAAEPLHWRVSKDDFAAVANGAPFPCDPKQRCRIGWWTIIDHARDETVTVVWFLTGHNNSCYGGRGLAHPNDQTIDERTLRAAITELIRISEISITRARDGWYHVCAAS